MGFHRRKDPPPPPPPPPMPAPRAVTSRKATQPPAPQYPKGSFGIGVETEFLLEPRRRELDGHTLREVSIKAAEAYNAFLSTQGQQMTHPAMHNAINQSYHGAKFAEWSLDSDSTIDTPNKDQAPWGLENISPIFRSYENSTWRQHIDTMWRFITTNYRVSANASCGTHVHLSRAGGFTLDELKRVCQCIIHFEPAFEGILPRDRLSNEYARSNWLDNPNFGHKNLSRRESMDVIQRAASMRDLVLLMNPDHDKMFGWNFLYLLNSPHGTIEFRRGAASISSSDVFMWIEIAMSFVQASIQGGSRDNLARVPATAGGLRWFIEAARLPDGVPGLYDSRYLRRFFSNIPDKTFRQPVPLGRLSSAKLAKLKYKKEEDKRKTVILSKMAQEPFWD
ncbi:hypothetical protein FSPOR_11936 [Fusarium sporotrichioides]|uniref:Amidoligase enzyme n=1 Tax=Fusarium sporotrichioides TaxID=5514 RepID=A0A395RD12_FUSSP|nr:hypothetical protein FSPOR_11936 [Fusarium sporotrichioides]